SPIAKSENWFAKLYGLTDCFVVLYSGNLGRYHDSQTFLNCAQLLMNRPDIKFVFIGNCVGSQVIKQAIASCQLPNVLQLPYQDREVLSCSLTACDLSLVSILPNVGDIALATFIKTNPNPDREKHRFSLSGFYVLT
ncbi:MAG: hypothetical protein IM576_00275, partial [Pseudanabaena sp. M074S1SP2A07QC]|nr:hypothetical protein [Pseudanabaena sp. M074S1SP2A07QC]